MFICVLAPQQFAITSIEAKICSAVKTTLGDPLKIPLRGSLFLHIVTGLIRGVRKAQIASRKAHSAFCLLENLHIHPLKNLSPVITKVMLAMQNGPRKLFSSAHF